MEWSSFAEKCKVADDFYGARCTRKRVAVACYKRSLLLHARYTEIKSRVVEYRGVISVLFARINTVGNRVPFILRRHNPEVRPEIDFGAVGYPTITLWIFSVKPPPRKPVKTEIRERPTRRRDSYWSLLSRFIKIISSRSLWKKKKKKPIRGHIDCSKPAMLG